MLARVDLQLSACALVCHTHVRGDEKQASPQDPKSLKGGIASVVLVTSFLQESSPF